MVPLYSSFEQADVYLDCFTTGMYVSQHESKILLA